MTSTRIFSVAIALLASACATQTAQAPAASSAGTAAAAPRSADVISLAELSDPSVGDLDALSIIKRLRPSFLVTRGNAATSMNANPGIHVTIGGGPLQPVSALTTIHANEMLEIR